MFNLIINIYLFNQNINYIYKFFYLFILLFYLIILFNLLYIKNKNEIKSLFVLD
jgi:hypothetical protein